MMNWKTACIVALSLSGGLCCAEEDLIVHEWGTFTGVVGASGEPLAWRPNEVDVLPNFVHQSELLPGMMRLGDSSGYFGKMMIAKQRMETPVVYFYADEPTKVDVTASWGTGQGTFTEWYPQVAGKMIAGMPVPLSWKGLEVLAKDAEVEFPHDGSANHYYPSREVDANPVRMKGEVEKLLFYRGVTGVEAPLGVRAVQGRVMLSNAEEDAVPGGVVVEMRGDLGRIVGFETIEGEDYDHVDLPEKWEAKSAVMDQLDEEMKTLLLGAGLYPREADAMISTWRESWFGEEGLRVLYLMQDGWVARTLPLSVKPSPQELTRVMVGRVEVISPEVSWEVARAVALAGDEDPAIQARGKERFEELRLGRFSQMAVNSIFSSIPQGVKVGEGLWKTEEPEIEQ